MRIVVRAADARVARDAQALLAGAGVTATALAGPYRQAPDGEDIRILIDGEPEGDVAGLLTQVVGCSIETAPVVSETGAIALNAPPRLLATQLDAWTRVAIAEEECARRLATATALGITPPKPMEPRKLKALYIGAPSSVFLALERTLTDQGGLVAAAFTSYTGFDHLHDELFDAVVLNGADNPSTALSLCSALQQNFMNKHDNGIRDHAHMWVRVKMLKLSQSFPTE